MKKLILIILILLLSGCISKEEDISDFKIFEVNDPKKLFINKYEYNIYKNEYKFSETNVQVRGVDEADIVKTNGCFIFYSPTSYFNKKTYIINSKALNVTNVIKDGNLLYLKNNTLIIINRFKNTITSYDISNPKKIRVIWKKVLNGSYVDSRVYKDKIYLIIAKGDYPQIWYDVKLKYYIPNVPICRNYIISEINIKNGKINRAIALAGGYNTIIYMSRTNIYLTYYISHRDRAYLDFIKENAEKYFPEELSKTLKKIIDDNLFSDEAKLLEVKRRINSYIYQLPKEDALNLKNILDKDFTNYLKKNIYKYERTGIVKIDLKSFSVKSSSVPGRLINRYAMDEYNGNLRLVTTLGDPIVGYRNNVYVLNSNLKLIGKLENIEEGKKIFAVRFLKDKVFIITYYRKDPLLVISLDDHPKILGYLNISGYSTYLHFINNDKLLAIGKDDDGKIKIDLYNISNYNNPKLLDRFKLDKFWSLALYNPHAFLWNKENKILAIPIERSAYIFKIDNEIKLKKIIEHLDYVERVIYINNHIFSLSPSEVVKTNITSWKSEKLVIK
ncbi:hypothetical protein J422_05653 [Methanocaldococcus villosus KIN24-T80]|uniref:Uncharacterized protein n=1 Tax=Methanocaldococcus villosus KIN24-T80 TaxID=1069083 RepID=N6V0K9_9EURY|nr:beta-propeller domain-containing protein [Methanocaldococcus villosus]ENN95853.1 hypothetical protein J422_05653 [Methanocaldococcus villosus KIN24-T80]